MTDVTKTALRNLTTHINPTPNWCTFLWFLCTLKIAQSTKTNMIHGRCDKPHWKMVHVFLTSLHAENRIMYENNSDFEVEMKSEKSDEIFALFENRKSRSYKAEIWKLWRDFRAFRKPKIAPTQSWNLKICVDFYRIEKRKSRAAPNNS